VVLSAVCVLVVIAARRPPGLPEHAFEGTSPHDTEAEVKT
jgi:hypothetical protein